MSSPTRADPPLAGHRLLGDGSATALLRPDGEVDWWCAPSMDDPPVLWSLLDPAGAAARWLGVRYLARPLDGPVAGPTARTVLRGAAGRVETWDALRCAEDRGSALIRLARGLDADLELTHELRLGGFDTPPATWSGPGRVAVGERPVVVGVLGGDGALEADGRHLATVRAPKGRWAAVVVSFDVERRLAGTDPDADAAVDALADELGEADEEVAALGRRSWLPGPFPQRSADALDVLRTCTFAPTGAVVAAPTTSLPEAPSHDRQFDYRFTWLRDASLAVSVAALLGHREQSDAHLRFIVDVAAEAKVPSGPMTTVRGETVPDEREVEGVAGWAGSRPVRVGNAARDQVQYDALGFLVEAVSVHVQMGGPLTEEAWRLVRSVADHVAEDGEPTSGGIWELREPRPLVSADLGRWLCLDRALWLARVLRPTARRRHWKRARAEARGRLLAALEDDGRLPQSYGGDPDEADASALLLPVLGFLPRRDPRAGRVVDAVLAALDAAPFLYRYEPGGDDGFSGTEGAFLPCSWWVVSALAAVGRLDEARQRAAALDAALPRLLAEEVDPVGGEALGNVPLVWSHMEAARALYLLHVAGIRERWTVVGLGAWRVARYLAARRRPTRGLYETGGAT